MSLGRTLGAVDRDRFLEAVDEKVRRYGVCVSLALDGYDPDQIAGAGLLPIAEDGNDGGPLVVDVRAGGDPDVAPIRLWDHDARSVGPALYPNAATLLATAAHLLRGGRVADLASLGAPMAAEEYAFLDET